MIKVFFGDAKVYQNAVPTKDELIMRAQIATENYISMNEGVFDFPDDWDKARKKTEIKNTKRYRDKLIAQIKDAPDEPQLVPFNSVLTYDECGIALIYCYADLGGEKPARLWILNSDNASSKLFEDIGFENNGFMRNGDFSGMDTYVTAPVEPTGDLTISKEDAKMKTDKLLQDLGLDDFECAKTCIAGKTDIETQEVAYGYAFYYTRNVMGIPMAVDIKTKPFPDQDELFKINKYQPETILITVNDNGIRNFQWENMLKTGDVIEQNAKLMPFDEISGLIEQNIYKVYGGVGDYLSNEKGKGDDWRKTYKYIIYIDRVSLEYARMPLGGDLNTQVLVPVWSIHATTDEWQWWKLRDGEKYLDPTKNHGYIWLNNVILTINAIDGSIIGTVKEPN